MKDDLSNIVATRTVHWMKAALESLRLRTIEQLSGAGTVALKSPNLTRLRSSFAVPAPISKDLTQ